MLQRFLLFFDNIFYWEGTLRFQQSICNINIFPPRSHNPYLNQRKRVCFGILVQNPQEKKRNGPSYILTKKDWKEKPNLVHDENDLHKCSLGKS